MNYFDCVEKKNINIQFHEAAEPIWVGGSLDANGQTYYEFRETITEKYTCVITVDSGVVRYINEDASTISPHVGERVFGIDDYPADIAFDGTWIYDTDSGEFSQCADIVTARTLVNNARLRAQFATLAAMAIATLQAGIAINRSLNGDSDTLTSWQNYLCDLRAMTPEQLQQSPAVFPVQPDSVI